jgi:acyl-CoA synthetase (AMP-forming)/AMP-acid ligase II
MSMATGLDTPSSTEFTPFPAHIKAHARTQPDRPAISDTGGALSWREFDERIDRIGARLQAEGVRRGDPVAIGGRNAVGYALAYCAALRIGAAPALLTASAAPEAIGAMLADCGARHLFLDGGLGCTLEPAGAAAGVQRIAFDDSDAGEPLTAWMGTRPAPPAPVEIRPTDAFNIIYSSGTTGAPKGIVQSHAMRAVQIGRAVPSPYDADAVTIVSTPLYSNTTLVSFIPAIAAGGRVVLMAKFGARDFCELAERERATHAMLVPVQYQRMMALPDFDRFDLSSFRHKSCTSAPFPAALKAEVLRRWPGRLVEHYGLTEGGASCILVASDRPDKLHTVGRPRPGDDIRLIDEGGREVAPGEVGEIAGRSEAMMTGYFGREAQTREVEWWDEEGRRYFRQGDLGRFDPDGFLILEGRKKDLIISGGFNIYPADLERELCAHPAVADAAVVAAPSPEWGETPEAFVVLREPAADPAAILDAVNARLGRTQRIRALHFLAEMPRNAIGKVLKRELRQRLTP